MKSRMLSRVAYGQIVYIFGVSISASPGAIPATTYNHPKRPTAENGNGVGWVGEPILVFVVVDTGLPR